MTQETVAPLNLHQRINEVRKKVAYLRKEKEVKEGGGYKVVTHDQVTGELREHLIEHGVIIEPPSFVSGQVVLTGTTTAKGIPFIRFEATYKVAFVNMDCATDRIVTDVHVHAIDQGDKAPGKAMSYAKKGAVLKLFEIETGEEDEDRPDAEVELITQEQIFEMHAYCEENGLPGDETLKAMATKAFNLKDVKELPKARFQEAKDMLKLKVKSNGTAKPGVEGSKGGKDNGK
jgi:hypothetical protein